MKELNEKQRTKRFYIITTVFIIACFIAFAATDIKTLNSFVKVNPIPDNITEEGYVIINLNTATLEDLIQVDGIGPVTAQKILDYREKYGSFLTVDELTKVSGIGESTLKKIRKRFTV